ncbi:thermonuclease family protein [Paenibacillus chungangensis]|uniref:Thermonuclease family protein n=1 Tax=Paenibacillus chungangensis TaxID=696535 RepID=A0ABW3HPI0_9BACL
MIKYLRIALLLVLASAAMMGCSLTSGQTSQVAKSNTWYEVADYVDGDTFKVKVGDEMETIRLLYIDTPEINKSNTPAEPYGPEAAAYTRKLLQESGEVRLAFDKELKDRYERTLAIVELKDGQILNEQLLRQGLAKVLIIEPNVKMENIYKQLEQEAKGNKAGLWNSGKEASIPEVHVKKATDTGLLMEVDKPAELVTIANTTSSPIDLEDWKLVSVRGNQTYTFDAIELPPGGKVTVKSGKNKATGNEAMPDEGTQMLIWEVDNVWNNYEEDPAELYNDKNELAAIWEDK